MSIFFDFEVGPSGRRFRRAVDGDKDYVKLLLDSSHAKLFGDVDIGGLIELATLSICMINADKEVIGFMALCDHPNVPGVDPAHWEMWMRNLFQKFYLARNTLFIHFMCCAKEVEDFFVEEALISVFQNDYYLLHIVIMIPPNCPGEFYLKYNSFRKRNFYKYCAQKHEDTDCNYCFYTAVRQDFCPKLKIRRAVEEDNDDITAILDKKCPKLKDLYGDFYISEIIGRHPEMNRKIIVADSQSIAVGVMCLNSDINYEALQKTYELEPYHGLVKTTSVEKEKIKRNNMLLRIFGEPIMMGNWSPFEQITKCEAIPIADDPSREKLVVTKTPKSLSRVYFGHDAMTQSIDNFYIRQQQSSEEYSEKFYLNSPPLHCKSDHSVVELLEEDPFDYEIVNIDTALLAIPEVLSCDKLSFPKSISPRQSGISQIQESFKRRMSTYKRTPAQEPVRMKYDGEPNAFMIELFGFREDIDERNGYDLLEAAFEIMNKYDYCIIRTPCDEKSFPLLQHFSFVPYKPNVCSKYALYVAHRSSVISKLRVRRAEIIDIPQIAQLMHSLDGKQTIWSVEDTILRRNKLEAYVFLSGVSLIGVGILEPPEHIDILRAKFNMGPYRIHKYHCSGRDLNAGFSTLKVVLAYPAFEPHYRFFIRDMMRQSNVTTLLWLTGYRNKWVIQKANSVASSMVPLLPRKYELDPEHVDDVQFAKDLSSTLTSFSAWFMNKKMTTIPKVNINTRIVIIGSSRTAISFINKLIFSDTSSYLMFTNVTLISKGGLPYVRRSKGVAEMMFLKRQRGGEKFLKTVPYTYYVNVIQGTMVDINKKEKYIKLANGSKCYYDMLFLLFGKQYQHPSYLKGPLQRERAIRVGTFQYTPLDVPSQREAIDTNYDTPDNVFIITSMADANKALQYVNTLLAQYRDYNIIVYGACIHAYCCLSALLQMKVPGQNIIFVEPFPPESPTKTRVSVFCNDYVDNEIKEMLDRLKINVYRSFYFNKWITDFFNVATHVEFLSNFKLLRLDCGAFFYYGKRSVDEQAFIAINKSGMAYDGGIIIDHEFRTLDPAIYAAGTATRYNRRYYAESKRQKYYDSREVGEKLGEQIRNQLDPLFTEKQNARKQSVKFSLDTILQPPTDKVNSIQGAEENTNRNSSCDDAETYKLPDFKMPRVTHCTLPGDLQYLEVRPPAAKIPHHYVQSLQYNGLVMETFKSGYFKLRLTNELIVDGITCLTSKKYPLDDFVNLYGLSAVVLNNVHLRYTAKHLDNFYEFFRAPWAVFLYHDQTDELFAMVKELLPKGQHQGDTLRDGFRAVARKLSKTESFTADTKLALRSNFEQSPHIEAITDYVMEWVSENDILLPMYLQPSNKSYTYDIQRNPAFKKRKRSLTKMLSAVF